MPLGRKAPRENIPRRYFTLLTHRRKDVSHTTDTGVSARITMAVGLPSPPNSCWQQACTCRTPTTTQSRLTVCSRPRYPIAKNDTINSRWPSGRPAPWIEAYSMQVAARGIILGSSFTKFPSNLCGNTQDTASNSMRSGRCHMNERSTQKTFACLHNGSRSHVIVQFRSLARLLLGLTAVFTFFFGPLILTIMLNPRPPRHNVTACLQNLTDTVFEYCLR